MWKSAAIAFLCIICVVARITNDAGRGCPLDVTMYMPFACRIAEMASDRQPGKGITVATGAIIAPQYVVTSCTALFPVRKELIEVQALQTHYTSAHIEVNEDQFLKAAPGHDQDGCIQAKPILNIFNHKRCPKNSDKPWDESNLRYNVAVLQIIGPWKSNTETVPVLTIAMDITEQLSMIGKFNEVRTERCTIPFVHLNQPVNWYEDDTAVTAIPFVLNCSRLICNQAEKPDECHKTVLENAGYIVCAKQVKQNIEGAIRWHDFELTDTDVGGEDYFCTEHQFVLGAPLICHGAGLGIVTRCEDFGFVISTMFSVGHFLEEYIDKGYTETVIPFDTTDVPTDKNDRDTMTLATFDKEYYADDAQSS